MTKECFALKIEVRSEKDVSPEIMAKMRNRCQEAAAEALRREGRLFYAHDVEIIQEKKLVRAGL